MNRTCKMRNGKIMQIFKLRSLPDHVSFQIQALEQQRYARAQNRDLTQANSPQLIWLGNGEVKPVRIQFFLRRP